MTYNDDPLKDLEIDSELVKSIDLDLITKKLKEKQDEDCKKGNHGFCQETTLCNGWIVTRCRNCGFTSHESDLPFFINTEDVDPEFSSVMDKNPEDLV